MLREVRAGTQGRNLGSESKAEGIGTIVYWLALYTRINYFITPRITCSVVALTILNMKMLPRACFFFQMRVNMSSMIGLHLSLVLKKLLL